MTPEQLDQLQALQAEAAAISAAANDLADRQAYLTEAMFKLWEAMPRNTVASQSILAAIRNNTAARIPCTQQAVVAHQISLALPPMEEGIPEPVRQSLDLPDIG